MATGVSVTVPHDITPKLLRSWKPPEGSEPTYSLPEGGKFYGSLSSASGVPHGNGIALFGDGSRYGGTWREGHQHGRGAIVAQGYEYHGDLVDDRMHGTGVIHYKESLIGLVTRGISIVSPGESIKKPLEYRGTFDKDHHRHGKGTMTYRNGDKYEGDWVSNQRHGTGSLTRDDGERYVGEFRDDERCGQGTVSYPNGQVFTGHMKDNKRTGMGSLVFPNGDEYTGNFDDDAIGGEGTMRYKNGDLYDGQWRDGLRHGSGKFRLKKNDATVSGNFYKGLIHGKGSVEIPGRSFFVGDFEKGERMNGTLWLHDGSCYYGAWRGDAMNGKGIMWFANGDLYFGSWINSVRQGPGNMNYANGGEYSGEFSDNKRHGSGIYVHPRGDNIDCGQWQDDELLFGYRGEWDGAAFSGCGKFITPSGLEYDGLWVNGVRDAMGQLSSTDGFRYLGSWSSDTPDGVGYLAFPSGEAYRGEFLAGSRCGTGVCWHTDGRMYSGQWEQDVQHGRGVLFEVNADRPVYEAIPEVEAAEDADAADGNTPTPAPKKKSVLSFFFRSKKSDSDDSAAQAQRRILGYEPKCIVDGTFRNHKLSGKSTVFLPDGSVFQGNWLESKIRIEMPHRGNIIGQKGKESQCPFCKTTYGFFRKMVKCGLCGRHLCSSCVKETSNQQSLGCVALEDIAEESTELADGTAPSTTNALAASANSLDTSQRPLFVSAGTHVRACIDCVSCLQQNVHRGTLWDATGLAVYRGFFAGDTPHGDGSLWLSDLSCFTGSFVMGKRSGYGTQNHQNGDAYTGEWADDAPHGHGSYCRADGVVFQGRWEDGKLSSLEYCGEMTGEDGVREGRGVSFDAEGEKYNGDWVRNKRHGMGILTRENGWVYSGEFYEGQLEGSGRLVSSGSVYVGVFHDGKRNGPGSLRTGDKIVSGTWIDDQLNGTVSTKDLVTGDESISLHIRGEVREDLFQPKPNVPDADITKCQSCNNSFSLFTRKHHCRCCGGVFDDNCSRRRISLPAHFGKGVEPQRVCMRCYIDVSEGQSMALQYRADGSIAAQYIVKGVWKGAGMLRTVDGELIVSTHEQGFAAATPASDTDIRAFVEKWNDILALCEEKLPLADVLQGTEFLRTPTSPLASPDAFSFDDRALENHLFHIHDTRPDIPAIVPPPPARPHAPSQTFLDGRYARGEDIHEIYPESQDSTSFLTQLGAVRKQQATMFSVKPASPEILELEAKAAEEESRAREWEAAQVRASRARSEAAASAVEGGALLPPTLLESDQPDELPQPCDATDVIVEASPQRPDVVYYFGRINKQPPSRPPYKQHQAVEWDEWSTYEQPTYKGAVKPEVQGNLATAVQNVIRLVPDRPGASTPPPGTPVAGGQSTASAMDNFTVARSSGPMGATPVIPVGATKLPRLGEPLEFTVSLDGLSPNIEQRVALTYAPTKIGDTSADTTPTQQHCDPMRDVMVNESPRTADASPLSGFGSLPTSQATAPTEEDLATPSSTPGSTENSRVRTEEDGENH